MEKSSEHEMSLRPANVPMDEVWTTEEVAEYLKVSADTVRAQAKKGRLPGAFQVASMWRFNSSKIRQMAA